MKGIALSLCLLLCSAGCTSLSIETDTRKTPLVGHQSASVIVNDLVGVLVQLVNPLDVTVQFSAPQTAFGQVVVKDLRERSFGMQRVSDDQGARYLSYSETVSTDSGKSRQFHYQVALGTLSAERSYEFKRGRLLPAAPMVVRGSRESASLSESPFAGQASELGFIHQIDYRETDLAALSVPRISLVTGQLVSEIASSTLSLPDEVGVNATNIETKNIYYTNESNFSRITRNYKEVKRDIILFADDSLRLGSVGKKQVRKMLAEFDHESDFINLIGCSQGVTKNKGGNEGLALGRAKRVFEEFVSLGVPRTSLLDEGCWAPQASQARYPGRAVVVILKRRKS